MNELIGRVAERSGINAEQARTAVETVVAHLKDKLPEPVAAQVDGLLAGGSDGPSLGEAIKNLRAAMGS